MRVVETTAANGRTPRRFCAAMVAGAAAAVPSAAACFIIRADRNVPPAKRYGNVAPRRAAPAIRAATGAGSNASELRAVTAAAASEARLHLCVRIPGENRTTSLSHRTRPRASPRSRRWTRLSVCPARCSSSSMSAEHWRKAPRQFAGQLPPIWFIASTALRATVPRTGNPRITIPCGRHVRAPAYDESMSLKNGCLMVACN